MTGAGGSDWKWGAGESDGPLSQIVSGDGDGDGDGAGLGGKGWREWFRQEDKITSLTLPKTELSSPRFFAEDPEIIWANCFNLWGNRNPKSEVIEASTTTGGSLVDPFLFVTCRYTFWKEKTWQF